MQLRQCNILFADDEEQVISYTGEVLSLMGKEIFLAKNGKEALETFQKREIDIVILDIDMPFLNGLEVAKEIRKINRITPIIISTAYSTKEYLLEAVELNLSSYLLKPITFENLKVALDKALDNLTFNKVEIINFDENTYYNVTNRELYLNNKIISLRNTEMQFLEYMLKNPNRVISYEELERNLWEEGMSSPAVRSLVRDIRKYLPKEAIVNISKVGYKLIVNK